MKHTKTIALMSAAGLALTILPASARPGNRGGGRQADRAAAAMPVEEALSAEEAATLSFMREEEKLARDVYLYLFDIWGNRAFSNISKAEQRHMDALKVMLDKYGLPDPVAADEGVFNNPELQDLYDLLVLKGSASELDALMVGGLIEEVDIEDLVDAIAESDHADLDRVYTNLMKGSDNHLRAFAGQIEKLTGKSYTAQHLTQEKVDAILDAPGAKQRGAKQRGAKQRGGNRSVRNSSRRRGQSMARGGNRGGNRSRSGGCRR
jgi:hypothetical protein